MKIINKIGSLLCILLLSVSLTASLTKPVIATNTNFKENITLTFIISNDYKVSLEGKIELTNITDKKVSLTDYELILPIVKLKNTKITRISPDAFLIDSFRENNSNLFKIKSSQSHPAILGQNGKIVFDFTAELDNPYTNFGQMEIFDLPFQVTSKNRTINIDVDIDKSMPLILAPDNIRSEWNTYRTSLTDTSGKTFVFLKNDMTVVVKCSTNRTAKHVLVHDFKDSCIAHDYMNCENCGSGFIDAQNNITFNPKDEKTPLIFSSEFKLDKQCLTQKFIQQLSSRNSDPNTVSKSRIVGLVLYPTQHTLVPAEWVQELDTKTNTAFYTDSELKDKSFPFAWDQISAFHIPVAHCDSDESCSLIKSELANSSKTISIAGQKNRVTPQLLDPSSVDLSINSLTNGSYELVVKNKSNSLGIISSLELRNNPIFEMNSLERRIVVPGGESTFEIIPKNKIPVRNIPTDLTFTLNGTKISYTYTPSDNVLLQVIYILGIVFVIVFGVFILSLVFLFLYNTRYGTKNKT